PKRKSLGFHCGRVADFPAFDHRFHSPPLPARIPGRYMVGAQSQREDSSGAVGMVGALGSARTRDSGHLFPARFYRPHFHQSESLLGDPLAIELLLSSSHPSFWIFLVARAMADSVAGP